MVIHNICISRAWQEVWTSLCWYVLLLQIPIVLLAGFIYLRLEMIMSDIKSGKNAISLEDFVKSEMGDAAKAGAGASQSSHGGDAGGGGGTQHYCGAHGHTHSHH